MRKYLILIFFFCCCLNVQAQNTDREASFLYYGQYLQVYCVNAQHPDYTKPIDSLKKDFTFIVNFNIDTFGKVINLSYYEENKIPLVVKELARSLILKTNGAWLPQVKDCRQVISDTISCLMRIRTKDKTQTQRWLEEDKALVQMNDNGVSVLEFQKNSKIHSFDLTLKNHCQLDIYY